MPINQKDMRRAPNCPPRSPQRRQNPASTFGPQDAKRSARVIFFEALGCSFDAMTRVVALRVARAVRETNRRQISSVYPVHSGPHGLILARLDLPRSGSETACVHWGKPTIHEKAKVAGLVMEWTVALIGNGDPREDKARPRWPTVDAKPDQHPRSRRHLQSKRVRRRGLPVSLFVLALKAGPGRFA